MTPRNLKSVLTGQRLLGLSVAEWTAFGLYALVLVLVLPYHEAVG
jgi:disulfide bond formation protein DsbB